ncbi:glycosyltransferase [Nocardia neocaledoniensis]|uniref:glycosyltransferase n=1 Tax=Nocardia neocaledoniensis TaxID=236511 RepID=UPI0024546F5A|nr:glycosyltransferase [Nocardia neocaledoniensis]
MGTPDSSPPVLSVVIPALDEAAGITACLERLVGQDAIDEIIVVDNGSTDGTRDIIAELASRHPKIELIDEPEPGVAHARNAGFAKARGDYLGRIDADTLVASDWGATVRAHLDAHPDTMAVTGISTYHDSPIGFFLAAAIGGQQRLGLIKHQPVGNVHGANMAIRRSAWEQVLPATTTRRDLHEDLDLALCLTKAKLRIDQLPQLRAEISARRRQTPPAIWWKYQLRGLQTIANQGYNVVPFHRAVITGAWVMHTSQWPIYRAWDFDRKRFSLRPGRPRVSPVGD